MAKYTRHDPRNKKRNKHKEFSKEGKPRRMKRVGGTEKWKDLTATGL